jgi:hypothetical protein
MRRWPSWPAAGLPPRSAGRAAAEAVRGSLQAKYAAARQRGDYDIVAAVAGKAVGPIGAREPAATLIESMTQEALAMLARGAGAAFT